MTTQLPLIRLLLIAAVAVGLSACANEEDHRPVTTSTTTTESTTLHAPVGVQTTETRTRY